MVTKSKKNSKLLSVMNPNAAGIDIGSKSHFVSIPADRGNECVREFKAYTDDLREMARWLKESGVDTVAMEATGVYWIPAYEVLDEAGFKCVLVNARHYKNVPGKKTDVADCQWLQQLHTFGLLRGSFRPDDEICRIRSIRRTRETLIQHAAQQVQLMQKALNQMNILLHTVINDITGVSGLRILEAIVSGEKSAVKLASLCDSGCKKSREEIARALNGNFRQEHIFSLKVALDCYHFYQSKIEEVNSKIKEILDSFENIKNIDEEPLKPLPPNRRPRKRVGQNYFDFDLREELYRKAGVDLTLINGISVSTALTILTEIGFSVESWATDKHFSSWLGLCPNNKISGGKILSQKTKVCPNRVSLALRKCAISLDRSQTALGSFYRRMKSRLGAPKAITATAHKLARIIYSVMKNKKPFEELDSDYYEKAYRERLLKNLTRKAKAFGMTLIPQTI